MTLNNKIPHRLIFIVDVIDYADKSLQLYFKVVL